MVDINSVFGSGETLKAADLQGRDVNVIISAVEVKNFDDGNKLIVRFEGKKKSLVCNKTNANRIGLIAKSTNTDAWPGVKITLTSELVDFKGDQVPAIRVRAPVGNISVASGGQYHSPRSAPANRLPAEQALNDEIPF